MSETELKLEDVTRILSDHRDFFNTHKTLDINFRIQSLLKLKNSIKKYEDEIFKALKSDLNKCEFEAYSTEIGYVLSSITNTIKNINKWSKIKKVRTPIFLLPAKEYIINEPYGTVLIVGPYNYPFQLVIEPLIGAISAGNCAVIKPSELTPNVSKIVKKIISETFDENYIRCVEGGIDTNTALTSSPFDYIFFTGSPRVAKIIMKAAAQHLTPVTLELGGKSPVIVDESANISVSARRIIWGKTVNAGQTCIAPDYVYVHENVKEKLISEMINAIKEFYGENPEESENFGHIINERHFDRITSIIDKDSHGIIYGGRYNKKDLYIDPTLIDISFPSSAAMEEEIFGPVLPIISYSNLNKVIDDIKSKPKPLALYIFSENKQVQKKLLSEISSGGVSVNDTLMHCVNPNLPFGGVGNSGIGSYHGKYSFDTFSHKKSVSEKGTKLNITMLFPPYSEKKLNLIKKFLK